MPLPKSASIAARATEVYTEACLAVVSVAVEPQMSNADEYELSLPRLLPYLRQLLTCCACAGLLEDAMISVSCGHCYCYTCQFTPPVLKIQCRQCRERTGLVVERHLRLVVDCYRNICITLGDHLARRGRPVCKDPSTAGIATFDPLQELVKEVVSGVKVSRAVLMVIPPDKYLNARNSSHTTMKEDASSITATTSPTSLGNESSRKKSRLSKRKKIVSVPPPFSFDDDPMHTTGEQKASPIVYSEEDSLVVSTTVKVNCCIVGDFLKEVFKSATVSILYSQLVCRFQ